MSRGPSHRFLRSPSAAEAASGFPAGSPTGPKPWRFAARRIRNRVPLPPSRSSGRSLRFRIRRDPAEARFRLAVHGPKSWVRRFAAPGPKPGPARRRSRSPSAGGSARPKSRFLPDRSWTEVRCPACRFPARRLLVPGGRFTKPAAFASAKGKPASSAWRRLRQPPCLRFRPPCRPKATGRASARAVAGKAILRCRKIVSATT